MMKNLFQQDFVREESVCTTALKHPKGHKAVNTAKNIPGGYGVHIEAVSSPPCIDISCPVHGPNILEMFQDL